MDWNIIPIKFLNNHNLLEYDVAIIDEAQRINPDQLEYIINEIKKGAGNCIFSYDKAQTLAEKEEKNDIESKIKAIDQIATHALTEKIKNK